LKKYNKAKNEEVTFEIGDKVRHIINRNLFDKGSNVKWSENIYTIINKKPHSYEISNQKWYKYYELIRVDAAQTHRIIETRAKTNIPSKPELKKEITNKRRLNKEKIINQITPAMLKEKRTRKKTDKFHY